MHVSADPGSDQPPAPNNLPIPSDFIQMLNSASISIGSQAVLTQTVSQQVTTNPSTPEQSANVAADARTFRLCGTAEDTVVAKQIESYVSGNQFKLSLTSDGACATLSITLLGPAVSNQNAQTKNVNATSSTKLSVSTLSQGDTPARRITVEISSRNGMATVAINSEPLAGLSVPEGNSHEKWEQWLEELLKD
jgi:hypothetical protein